MKAVLDFYKTDARITWLVLNLPLCDQHRHELVVKEIFPPEVLDPLLTVVQTTAKVKVDRDACRIVRVPFDHPDYLRLTAMKAALRQEPANGI